MQSNVLSACLWALINLGYEHDVTGRPQGMHVKMQKLTLILSSVELCLHDSNIHVLELEAVFNGLCPHECCNLLTIHKLAWWRTRLIICAPWNSTSTSD